jgi:hypothetical protein
VLAASFFVGGCASVDKLLAPSLNGTPATSSLVVVVCEATMLGVFDLRTRQKVEFGVLVGKGGYGRFVGHAISNLIVFSDVPPGEYNLTGVRTTWVAGNVSYAHSYVVPESQASSFVVKTKLGEPAFLGVVAVEEVRKLHEQGVNFTLKSSKEAEAEAWEKFVQLYSGHPWAGVAQKRISELRP